MGGPAKIMISLLIIESPTRLHTRLKNSDCDRVLSGVISTLTSTSLAQK